jgi:uncharacterized protein YyaL (SSP411 family)
MRRLLPLLILTLSLHAQSRYVSDAAGAPVKWEGWGPRAIERATKENRPVFLVVGYASCFECFRIQREAFVDPQVAQSLNLEFVPVLLDRLEYPEVAQSYETLARSMNVSASWPLLLALTPSLEPYAASGPLSAADLKRALALIANRWVQERDAVSAEAHANVLKARARLEAFAAPAPERRVNPTTISQQLRAKQTDVATDALRKLSMSAIHDQLGGGFHRAARDDAWRQPYFEKLLSDQALLAIAYLEAGQVTRDPEWERVARETLDAAIRDLRHPEGGAFEASQDAHNLVPMQGPEFWNGAFYIWNKYEITRLLGPEGTLKVARAYGVKIGNNVLAVEDPASLRDPAIAPLLAKMLELRQKRPQPFREMNLVSGLNGLMISALARGGAVFGEKKYVDAALLAAQRVTRSLWNAKTQTLLHSPGVPATSADYAQLTQGMLDLFEASYDPAWLTLAITLQQRQDQLFWDANAARYTIGSSVPQIISGLLVERDDETPSVNSVAAMNLFRLAMLTGNETWRSRQRIESASDAKIVAVTGDPRRKSTFDALLAIHQRWEPLRFVLFVPSKGVMRDRMLKALPFTGALASDPENPITYECSGGECRRR